SASTHAEFGPLGRGGSGFGVSEVEEGAPFEVEDLATAFLRLDGGGTLLLESSWAQWIPEDLCYVTLYGAMAGPPSNGAQRPGAGPSPCGPRSPASPRSCSPSSARTAVMPPRSWTSCARSVPRTGPATTARSPCAAPRSSTPATPPRRRGPR